MSDQRAIDLIDSWLAEPPVRELFRRNWFCFVARHRERNLYVFPALAVVYSAPILGYEDRDFGMILYWWKWQVCVGHEKRAYATEEVIARAAKRDGK